MKSVIVSSVCISAILLVLAIHTVIDGKTAALQELEDSLAVSVSQTMKEVMEQESYGIQDKNEFIAAFLQALVMRTNSDVDMTVNVISADVEQGLMDIEVTEKITFLNMKEKEIKVRRTVIFEKKEHSHLALAL
ncbi:MAG: hypothetical protein HFG37_10290 [Eubacterium sp.]|nr:hypothetical protein [Eubacterium sp.]MCI9411074.1 hypothetical protein [Eubacterium sp.]